jgi:hypothetical protein
LITLDREMAGMTMSEIGCVINAATALDLARSLDQVDLLEHQDPRAWFDRVVLNLSDRPEYQKIPLHIVRDVTGERNAIPERA